MEITGGTLLLKEAISANGEIEADAFLVPIVEKKGDDEFKVFFETRDPKIIEAISQYFIYIETEEAKEKYYKENIDLFEMTKPVSGVFLTGSELKYNTDKLKEIADITNTKITEKVIFVQEKLELDNFDKYSGYFMILMGVLGIIKIAYLFIKERNIKVDTTGSDPDCCSESNCCSDSGSCSCEDKESSEQEKTESLDSEEEK